jgi:hypothetical protein
MKSSEKRLLFILLSMLVLGGVFLGMDQYLKRRDALLAEKARLETEWIVIETLFEEKEIWEMRAQWLAENQPPFTSSEQIDQAIYDEALAAEIEGVTTSKQTLMPTVTTPDYVQAGVSLTASGELRDVFRWIHELNRPESFRVIRNLKMAPDKEEPGKILAQFELLRWYAPPEA